jgi:hypothetical protein
MNNWDLQKAEIARNKLSQAGFTLTRHLDSIRCSPAPPPEIVAVIREHKASLLEILRETEQPLPINDGRHRPGGAGGDSPGQPSTTPDLVVWVQYECCDGQVRFMLKDDFDELSEHEGAWSMLFGRSARKPRGKVRPIALQPGETPKSWEELRDVTPAPPTKKI